MENSFTETVFLVKLKILRHVPITENYRRNQAGWQRYAEGLSNRLKLVHLYLEIIEIFVL